MATENLKMLSLKEVFKDVSYSIPIYQRSYAWGKTEIEQLINDIYDFSENDSEENNYYLGSLIVDKKSDKKFSVIDGQQRLTTLFLLFSYLKPKLLSETSLEFEARPKSNDTLKAIFKLCRGIKKIEDYKDFSIKDSLANKEDYSPEILSGINIIEEFFKSNTDKLDELKKLSDDEKSTNEEKTPKWLEKIMLLRTQVPKDINLNHYFEIMNTRGEQLEIHEIAKERVLSKIKDDVEYRVAAKVWDACSQMDSYVQMNFEPAFRYKIFGGTWDKFKPNNFDDLKALFVEVEKNRNDADKAKKDVGDGKSKGEFEPLSLREILSKSESINAKFESPTENEEKARFESIVKFKDFLLIVNEALKNTEEEKESLLDDKKFFDNLKDNWKDAESAKSFVFNLLKMRFLFDKYIVKREYTSDYKEGRWSLQKLERYNDGKNDSPKYTLTYGKHNSDDDKDKVTQKLRLLQSALRITYTSPKTMHWISKTLAILNENRYSDLRKFLEKYCCEKIVAADYKNKTGFAIERIVFTYLEYVLIRDGKIDKDVIKEIKNDKVKNLDTNFNLDTFQFQFRNSIEHFHPQHPIDSDKNPADDWSAKEELNSFGNLALITVAANSKFSNLSPASKIDSYPDTILQSPKLAIMSAKMKENGDVWDEKLVTEHNDEMMRILKEEIRKCNLNS